MARGVDATTAEGGIMSEDLDVRPENWHPDWLRYSEFEGVACILHYGRGHQYLCLCVVASHVEPTNQHTFSEWTPEFRAAYEGTDGLRVWEFISGQYQEIIRHGVNLWTLWDAKIRLTEEEERQ
jgi:hypothetical protein